MASSLLMDDLVEVSDECISGNFTLQPTNDIAEIDRIDGGQISYEDFFKNYLMINKPCILSKEMTSKWRSREDWVDKNNKPNFKYLRENFGKCTAPVADCKKQFFNAQEKINITVGTFLDYWETYIAEGHPQDSQCLYLKDWHFTKEFPDFAAYEWPKLFSSDWLNEYWSLKGGDDYKFVYMGPKGSWTPLHVDVFTSYSWSTNICGKKKWVLYPPGCEENLKSSGKLPYQRELESEHIKHGILVEQFSGETIFVPTGWHHQVWNEEDTISINHNWMNGCCIENSWKGLKNELHAVEEELADCKDMEGWTNQCQLVLKAVAGIDFQEFCQFLLFIAQKRKMCIDGEVIKSSAQWTLGKNHARFDLLKISIILEELCQWNPVQKSKEVNAITDILQELKLN